MKKALFLILNDPKRLGPVHDIFYRNACGATTIDSTGLGKILLERDEDVPIFSSLRSMIEKDKPYNKTIFSVIRSDAQLQKVIREIKEELEMDTVNKKGVAFMFVLPVVECYGYDLTECSTEDSPLPGELSD